MNRRIRILTVVVIVAFTALFVRLNQVQVLQAAEIDRRPGNTRIQERDFNRPRGTIRSADGALLAWSERVDQRRFKYQRRYPTAELFAHVVGSFSFQFPVDGVEARYADELAGRTAAFQISGLTTPLSKVPNVGDVTLTLRSDLQRIARDQLGDRKGSVVAVDPRDGSVLAMWSYPSYDPNVTSSNDQAVALAERQALDANPDKARLARAWRERYAPGSTFKVVTAAAGLESGKVTLDSPVFPVRSSYTAPLTSRPLRNFGGSRCGGTLVKILEVSCNTAFAQMGAEVIGPEPLIERAKAFGFDDVAPIDLPGAVRSVFPTSFGKRVRAGATPAAADVYENTPGLAQA